MLAKRKKRTKYDERKFGRLKTEKRGERQAAQRRRPAVKARKSVDKLIYVYKTSARLTLMWANWGNLTKENRSGLIGSF